MGKDEIVDRLMDIIMDGIDQKEEKQDHRLKSSDKSDRYINIMAKDVLKTDYDIRPDVERTATEIGTNLILEREDELLRNWEDRDKKHMNKKLVNEAHVFKELMKGARDPGLISQKWGSGGVIDMED